MSDCQTVALEDTRLAYKQDDFGNDIFARIVWSPRAQDPPRPIALIYHAGGLIAGSADMVPQSEVEYLCSRGFVVVLPNDRLVPQVSGRDAFKDCKDAFDWTIGTLPAPLAKLHQLDLDVGNVVAVVMRGKRLLGGWTGWLITPEGLSAASGRMDQLAGARHVDVPVSHVDKAEWHSRSYSINDDIVSLKETSGLCCCDSKR